MALGHLGRSSGSAPCYLGAALKEGKNLFFHTTWDLAETWDQVAR